MILFPTIYVIFWTASMALVAGVAVLPRLSLDYRIHMLLGLAAACVNCLLHTAVMIHLVGTGRSIKLAVPHIAAPKRAYTAQQTAIKSRSYPLSTICCLLACATAILGGARNFGAVSWMTHAAFGIALLAANLLALPIQYRLLVRNGGLVTELEGELEAVVKQMESKGAPMPQVMPWQA